MSPGNMPYPFDPEHSDEDELVEMTAFGPWVFVLVIPSEWERRLWDDTQ